MSGTSRLFSGTSGRIEAQNGNPLFSMGCLPFGDVRDVRDVNSDLRTETGFAILMALHPHTPSRAHTRNLANNVPDVPDVPKSA